jgi:hypothetical protein
MVRNVEKETFPDLPGQPIYQTVLPTTSEQLDRYADHMRDGAAFLYHLAEGTDPSLRAEYTLLRDAKCVGEGLVGIHSTALSDRDFASWSKAPGAIVWSPFSNIWLYGDTTDVVAARRRGITICLGSDWAPSGTRNLLGELKVAALWNETALDGALDTRELCELATRNPGQVLERAWKRPVGRLVEGALADLAVTSSREADPYENLLAATERHVRLVVIRGLPVYGSRSMLETAGVRRLESIVVAGVRRAIAMRLPRELVPDDPARAAEANLSWKDGLAQLNAVVRDPAGAVRKARQRKAFGTLEFIPDMPFPEMGAATRELTDDELDDLVIPPLDGLAHDGAWFDAVDRGHPHAKMLMALRTRFGRK